MSNAPSWTNADKAAMVAPYSPLFEWAREQSIAAKAIDERLAAARERRDRAERVLRESGEWRELDAAKERLADAKKAAIAGDSDVADERAAVKAARAALSRGAASVVREVKKAKADVKALGDVKAETERATIDALAAGKVPSAIGDLVGRHGITGLTITEPDGTQTRFGDAP